MNRMFGLVFPSAPNARFARDREANSGSESIPRRVIDCTIFSFPYTAGTTNEFETELRVARRVGTGDLTKRRIAERLAGAEYRGRYWQVSCSSIPPPP